jgi:uncharacterized YccA/Bax inhibitor family protein
MRSSNPAFSKQEAFAPREWGGIMADLQRSESKARIASTTMTVQGTIVKTAILLAIAVIVAVFAWNQASTNPATAMPMALAGIFGGLVVGLIIGFKPTSAPFLAPVYAILEGLILGVISLIVAQKVGPQGTWMVAQAVGITLGILAALLIAFSMGLIRIGSTATKVVIVATLGVGLVYVASMASNLFGFGGFGFIHQGTPLGIGFSIFVIALASFNLVLDFQYIESGVENQAPKYMEWYAGYGLLVTLVWLYIEVLRLLMKLREK